MCFSRTETLLLDGEQQPIRWTSTVLFPNDDITDAQGRFTIKHCFDRPHVVMVFAAKEKVAAAEKKPVQPGGPPVRLRITSATRPSAYCVGKVVGPQGALLESVGVVATEQSTRRDTTSVSRRDGSFRVGPLIPRENETGWSTVALFQEPTRSKPKVRKAAGLQECWRSDCRTVSRRQLSTFVRARAKITGNEYCPSCGCRSVLT